MKMKLKAQLKQEGVDLVLLDDAFSQERKPGLSILLTTIKLALMIFVTNRNLREGKQAQRADIIVVSNP